MKKSVLFTIALTAVMTIPVVVLAQNFDYIDNWLDAGLYWLRISITVVMVAMTLFFLIKVLQLIMAKDAAKQKEKKTEVFNAMLGLFLAVAVWGIIRIAGEVLDVNVDNTGDTPNVTCPPGTQYSRSKGICGKPGLL